jgi:ATP-dependent DNA helicase RecG
LRLDDDVQFLKGVGPKAGLTLKKLGIATLKDMLEYLPFRYEDRRHFRAISDAKPGEWLSLKGRIIELSEDRRKGQFSITRAALSDGKQAIRLIWFNQKWIKPTLQKHGGDVIVYGQVKDATFGLEMASPEYELVAPNASPEDFARITPIYRLKDGVPQKLVRRAAASAIATIPQNLADMLPEALRKRYGLLPLSLAYKSVHFPETEDEFVQARRRLVFDEFLLLQLSLAMRHAEQGIEPGIAFEIPDNVISEIRSVLPFDFTEAQKRVIRDVFRDMIRPHPMNRLLQGDVGSGKTAVAACAMLAAVRGGYQAALMAPTEILAEQHYANLKIVFEPLGLDVELLVGKQTATQKKKAVERTRSGLAHVAIGTHALIQEGVSFQKLGLVVVDEQHRFGVLQRGALRLKGYGNPDVLVMTATPIPRTLTLTLYGDLDLSVIDEMPPGRKPIKTHWKLPTDREDVYRSVRELVGTTNAQVYIVCPLVSESEKMLAQAAEELYKQLSEGAFSGLRVGLLHGQMKSKDKVATMEAFRRHELDVLVATTVIEVGVDVPNANIMVIEDANRFGLAQLHQLRGRVGRGGRQSYCLLIGTATTPDAEARLRVMVETTDGFRIAEEDLKIRGPGELYGTRQSGDLGLKLADLLKDGRVLEEARQAALAIVERDPQLNAPEHKPIRKVMEAKGAEAARTDVS